MASAWLGRGVGRGVRTRGGLGRSRGMERRYFRSDSNMFGLLSDSTTLSYTDGETQIRMGCGRTLIMGAIETEQICSVFHCHRP